MDSDRPRKDHTAALTVLISVLTTAALVGAAWGSLGERARIDTASIARLQSEIEELKRERASLATAVARMADKLDRVADDTKETRGDVKTLDAKVSAIRRR